MANARLREKTPFVRSSAVLWMLLERMLEEETTVSCVLDGLDECQYVNDEMELFITQLVTIVKKDSTRNKIIAISRLSPAESGDSQPLWDAVQIQPSSVRDDINVLASTRMESSRVLRIHPKKPQLLEKIVDSSDGMMLWAEPMITELEAGHWNAERVIETPPRGLFEVYKTILDRIANSKSATERVLVALKHVLAAAQPLRIEELALSIAVS